MKLSRFSPVRRKPAANTGGVPQKISLANIGEFVRTCADSRRTQAEQANKSANLWRTSAANKCSPSYSRQTLFADARRWRAYIHLSPNPNPYPIRRSNTNANHNKNLVQNCSLQRKSRMMSAANIGKLCPLRASANNVCSEYCSPMFAVDIVRGEHHSPMFAVANNFATNFGKHRRIIVCGELLFAANRLTCLPVRRGFRHELWRVRMGSRSPGSRQICLTDDHTE